MTARYRAKVNAEVAAKRRAYLGEVFLEHYPPDVGPKYGFEPQVEISPEIVAANCLGITYGDPGPRLPEDACRECWGDRHVWYGDCWGWRHTGAGWNGCQCQCHEGETVYSSIPSPAGSSSGDSGS